MSHGIIFVAEMGENVVGCLSAIINAGLPEGMFGEIVSLVVSREYRGSGIGKCLVNQAEVWFKPKVNKIRIPEIVFVYKLISFTNRGV